MSRHVGNEGETWASSVGVIGTCNGRHFGNLEYGVDRPTANVGEVFDGKFGFETSPYAFIGVNMMEVGQSIVVNAEPSTVTKCVSKGLEFL